MTVLLIFAELVKDKRRAVAYINREKSYNVAHQNRTATFSVVLKYHLKWKRQKLRRYGKKTLFYQIFRKRYYSVYAPTPCLVPTTDTSRSPSFLKQIRSGKIIAKGPGQAPAKATGRNYFFFWLFFNYFVSATKSTQSSFWLLHTRKTICSNFQ